MPFNGSGTFNLVSGNPVVTGTVISSTVHNNTTADFASGFTSCVTRTGQSTALSNLPMGGFKHTGAVAATAPGEYLLYGQSSANLSSLTVGTFTTTGNANINGNVTLGDAGTDTVTANAAITAAGGISISSGAITSNIYTPFLFAGSNVSSITPNGVAKWHRIGNIVTVYGSLQFTPIATGTSTLLYITLPIFSVFSTAYDCLGTAICLGTTSSDLPPTYVLADAVADRAQITYSGLPSVIARNVVYHFSYEVL